METDVKHQWFREDFSVCFEGGWRQKIELSNVRGTLLLLICRQIMRYVGGMSLSRYEGLSPQFLFGRFRCSRWSLLFHSNLKLALPFAQCWSNLILKRRAIFVNITAGVSLYLCQPNLHSGKVRLASLQIYQSIFLFAFLEQGGMS